MKPRITRGRIYPVWFVTTALDVQPFATWSDAMHYADQLARTAAAARLHIRFAMDGIRLP